MKKHGMSRVLAAFLSAVALTGCSGDRAEGAVMEETGQETETAVSQGETEGTRQETAVTDKNREYLPVCSYQTAADGSLTLFYHTSYTFYRDGTPASSKKEGARVANQAGRIVDTEYDERGNAAKSVETWENGHEKETVYTPSYDGSGRLAGQTLTITEDGKVSEGSRTLTYREDGRILADREETVEKITEKSYEYSTDGILARITAITVTDPATGEARKDETSYVYREDGWYREETTTRFERTDGGSGWKEAGTTVRSFAYDGSHTWRKASWEKEDGSAGATVSVRRGALAEDPGMGCPWELPSVKEPVEDSASGDPGNEDGAVYSIGSLTGYGEAGRLSVSIDPISGTEAEVIFWGSAGAASHMEWTGNGAFDTESGILTYGELPGNYVEYDPDTMAVKAVTPGEGRCGGKLFLKDGELRGIEDDGTETAYEWAPGKDQVMTKTTAGAVQEKKAAAPAESGEYIDLSAEFQKIHVDGYSDAWVSADAGVSENTDGSFNVPVTVKYYEQPLRWDDAWDSYAGEEKDGLIRIRKDAVLTNLGNSYSTAQFMEAFQGSFPSCLFVTSYDESGYVTEALWHDAG